MEKSELIQLHRDHTGQLVRLFEEYADLKVDELEGRRIAWENSLHTSIKGRDDDATFAVSNITSELHRILGQIKAEEAWLEHLKLALEHHD